MSENLSAKYYQENKERLQKKAHERYQNLSDGLTHSHEKKRKKRTRCSRTLQKFFRRWKTKACWG